MTPSSFFFFLFRFQANDEPEAVMRRRLRLLSILSVLGLAIWGCGPPQVVPMTPPGMTYQRVATDVMEAQGEVQSRGSVQNSGSAPGGPARPAANPQGAAPAEKLGPVK